MASDSKKLKVIIAVLAILLALSLLALTGLLFFRHIFPGAAIAPDNRIDPSPQLRDDVCEQLPLVLEQDTPDGLVFTTLANTGQHSGGAQTLLAADGKAALELLNVTVTKPEVLDLHAWSPDVDAPFVAGNMFPGDLVRKTYTIRVAHEGSVTVSFHIDIQDPERTLLDDVLRCRILIGGVQHYDGLMSGVAAPIDYTVAAGVTDVDYTLEVYLDTSVGNDYMAQTLAANFHWQTEVPEAPTPTPPTPPPGPGDNPILPELDKGSHYAYIIGRPGGLIYPQAEITRAETATIFFRMLTDESREYFWKQINPYYDVAPSQWFNNAISTLTEAGIVDGYPGNVFLPDASITRAEFATIASRFFVDEELAEGEDSFNDIAGHWANHYINLAYRNKLVDGYDDGSFRPDQPITRAEAMTIVNRILERYPDKDHLLDGMITWPDNMDTAAWYYAQVQEATNSHDYELRTAPDGSSYEVWTELLPVRDWEALEKEWSEHNSAANPGEVISAPITVNGSTAAASAASSAAALDAAELSLLSVDTLTLTLEGVELELDSAAIGTLADTETEQVVIGVSAVDAASLTPAQQAALAGYELHTALSATVNAGGVDSFNGGGVTIRLPFTPEVGKTYTVLYAAVDGSLEYVPSTFEDGCLVFTVSHFSEYVVVSGYAAEETDGKLTLPQSGRIAVSVLVPAALLALALAWIVKRRKEGGHEQ